MVVQLLEIINQIVDSLCVEESTNHLGWFGVVNSPQILLHGCIIVAFLVEEIAILSEDNILLNLVCPGLLSEIDRVNIQISLIENLEFLL